MGTKFTGKALLGVILMMIFGTGTMVASKMMLDTKSISLNGFPDKNFDKPWFQTFTMFNAMFICLIWYCLIPKGKAKSEGSINGDAELSPAELKKQKHARLMKNLQHYCGVAIPSLFDLLATTLMTFGLIPITVSVMQMLRGSMVIFSALLTVFVRKRPLAAYQWTGVSICCAAMVVVGFASVLQGIFSPDHDKNVYPWTAQLGGCFLVIGSQFIQACQIVVEEYILGDGGGMAPLLVVGLEGLWGQVLCLLCFIPLAYFIPGSDNGHMEDPYDSFVMISRNWTLPIIICVYWVAILFLNYGGMLVTSELTAVHRTIFEAVRTSAIWVTSIFIYYAITHKYGEPWTVWSYMQLVGFSMLIFSMLLYNKVIKFKCFNYETKKPIVAAPEETQTLLAPEGLPAGYQTPELNA